VPDNDLVIVSLHLKPAPGANALAGSRVSDATVADVEPQEDFHTGGRTRARKTSVKTGEKVVFAAPGLKPKILNFKDGHPFDILPGYGKELIVVANSGTFVYECAVEDDNGVLHTTGGGEMEVGHDLGPGN